MVDVEDEVRLRGLAADAERERLGESVLGHVDGGQAEDTERDARDDQQCPRRASGDIREGLGELGAARADHVAPRRVVMTAAAPCWATIRPSSSSIPQAARAASSRSWVT